MDCFKHDEAVFINLTEIVKDKQIIVDLKTFLHKNMDVLLKWKINDFLLVTQKDRDAAKQALEIYKKLYYQVIKEQLF